MTTEIASVGPGSPNEMTENYLSSNDEGSSLWDISLRDIDEKLKSLSLSGFDILVSLL